MPRQKGKDRGEARLVLLSGRVPEQLRKRFKMFCSATGKTEQEALIEAIEESQDAYGRVQESFQIGFIRAI